MIKYEGKVVTSVRNLLITKLEVFEDYFNGDNKTEFRNVFKDNLTKYSKTQSSSKHRI